MRMSKEWLENNIEIVDVKGNVAEVKVPTVKKLRIGRDSHGKYVRIRGMKIHSRYL